jgi:IclR family transcriptional regulator, KDG regulon repressor
MPSRDKDTYCIRSVENALFLLEALAEEDSKYSLSQLSRRLGMTKATLFRLMATFESHGYVERGQGPGEYKLGLAAFEVSQKLLSRMTLLHKARPFMAQLVRDYNETVYLVVQRDDEVLFLEMADSDQKVKVVSLIGRRFPLQSCAAGKIFLAFDPAGNAGLIGSMPGLKQELEQCREHGVVVDDDGAGEGCTSIAVPLCGSGGELVGGLVLVGPSFRINDPGTRTQLLPAVVAAGEMISARIGHLN